MTAPRPLRTRRRRARAGRSRVKARQDGRSIPGGRRGAYRPRRGARWRRPTPRGVGLGGRRAATGWPHTAGPTSVSSGPSCGASAVTRRSSPPEGRAPRAARHPRAMSDGEDEPPSPCNMSRSAERHRPARRKTAARPRVGPGRRTGRPGPRDGSTRRPPPGRAAALGARGQAARRRSTRRGSAHLDAGARPGRQKPTVPQRDLVPARPEPFGRDLERHSATLGGEPHGRQVLVIQSDADLRYPLLEPGMQRRGRSTRACTTTRNGPGSCPASRRAEVGERRGVAPHHGAVVEGLRRVRAPPIRGCLAARIAEVDADSRRGGAR